MTTASKIVTLVLVGSGTGLLGYNALRPSRPNYPSDGGYAGTQPAGSRGYTSSGGSRFYGGGGYYGGSSSSSGYRSNSGSSGSSGTSGSSTSSGTSRGGFGGVGHASGSSSS